MLGGSREDAEEIRGLKEEISRLQAKLRGQEQGWNRIATVEQRELALEAKVRLLEQELREAKRKKRYKHKQRDPSAAKQPPAQVNARPWKEGDFVKALMDLDFVDGGKVHEGMTGVVTRVPGETPNSPGEVMIGNVMFDADPAEVALVPDLTLYFVGVIAEEALGIAFRVEPDRRVLITRVQRDGPAHVAGIPEHSYLQSIGGRPIHSGDDIRQTLQDARHAGLTQVAVGIQPASTSHAHREYEKKPPPRWEHDSSEGSFSDIMEPWVGAGGGPPPPPPPPPPQAHRSAPRRGILKPTWEEPRRRSRSRRERGGKDIETSLADMLREYNPPDEQPPRQASRRQLHRILTELHGEVMRSKDLPVDLFVTLPVGNHIWVPPSSYGYDPLDLL